MIHNDSSARPRVLIFTGEGKGKTTAALGMALRAVGHGLRACVIQFVKAEGTGEAMAGKSLPGLEIVQTGLGFVPPPAHKRFTAHAQAAQQGLALAEQKIASGQYALVVLDEVCVAVDRGLLAAADVAAVVAKAPANMVIVLTGRGAPPELVELADTVTEMRCVKHGMEIGIKAQKGVEF